MVEWQLGDCGCDSWSGSLVNLRKRRRRRGEGDEVGVSMAFSPKKKPHHERIVDKEVARVHVKDHALHKGLLA